MKRIYSLLFIALVLNMGSVYATEVETNDEDTITDTDVSETNTSFFDNVSLETKLKDEIRQGTSLDLLYYYSGDTKLVVTIISGMAEVQESKIEFTMEGTVTFTVKDDTNDYGSFTVTVLADPIMEMTFNKETVSIAKGERVDLVLKYSPKDSLKSKSSDILLSYEGTGEVMVEEIFAENTDTIIGYRVTGKKTGKVIIKANLKDNSSLSTSVTIYVLGGSITENLTDTAMVVSPIGKTGPATGDTFPIALYLIVCIGSMSLWGYFYISKKNV